MMRLLNNEIIDQRLIDKNINIKRIGDYKLVRLCIDFQCLNCKHIWLATPDNISRGKGCPKCHHVNRTNLLRLDVNIVIKKLLDKNIILLSKYISTDRVSKLQCSICNYIWNTKISHVFADNSHCKRCAPQSAGEQLIINFLQNNKINFEHQYYINKIKNIDEQYIIKQRIYVDFYFEELNLIVEYNGHQHYMPVSFSRTNKKRAGINFAKQVKRDCLLRNWCIINNIKLVEIDGRAYTKNKLQNLLQEMLNQGII